MSVNKKEYFLNFIEKYNLYIFGILLRQSYKIAEEDIKNRKIFLKQEIIESDIYNSLKSKIILKTPFFLLKSFVTIINMVKGK